MAKRKAHRRGRHRLVIFPDKLLYDRYGKVQIMKYRNDEELCRLMKRIRAASLDEIYDKRKPPAEPVKPTEPEDTKDAA